MDAAVAVCRLQSTGQRRTRDDSSAPGWPGGQTATGQAKREGAQHSP